MNLSRDHGISSIIQQFHWQQQEHQHIWSEMLQPKDTSSWAMTGITYPGKHDVMLGRGGESNYHTGNLKFRNFIQEHKKRYQEARKQEKPIIALEVVLGWRELDPPGRFLARLDPSRADSLWEDVGDDQACKRAGRTLGEKGPSSKTPDRNPLSEDENPTPRAPLSADEAVNSVRNNAVRKNPSGPKGAGRSKRPRTPLSDDIQVSSLRSEQLRVAGKRILGDILSASHPLAKRRKGPVQASLGGGTAPPFKETSESPTNMLFCQMQEPPSSVTPETCVNKVMDATEVLQGKGTISSTYVWAYSRREDLPTAEFLTRNAFL